MNRSFEFVIGLAVILALVALAGRMVRMSHAQSATPSHASTIATQPADIKVKTETATFAAGCFWGVEETFRHVEGVVSTAVGYEGGGLAHPTYHDVCTDTTGHAEAVEVKYDPTKVSYEYLLAVFWANHDPTTLNSQGPDFGTQYRSAIFTHSPQQKEAAEKSKADMQKKYKEPITTEIIPATTFWRAEEYHQQYSEKNGIVCHRPIIPATQP